jgi:replicative DNA helicase
MNNPHLSVFTATQLVDQFTQRIESIYRSDDSLNGIASGYYYLDNALGGFQQGNLYVIAGRPLIGKTAFMMNLVHNMILHPVHQTKVVIFTPNLSAQLMMNRLISCASGVHLEKIERGKVEMHEWLLIKEITQSKISSAPLVIDESPVLTITALDEKCAALANGPGLDIVFIDSLQLMTAENGRYRDEKIALIMHGLKELTKKYAIPIVLISQLNPELGLLQDEFKVPQLLDLRKVGPIEQEADTVIFLYRHKYSDLTDAELEEISYEETWASIVKSRIRSLESVRFKAMLHIQKFIEYV